MARPRILAAVTLDSTKWTRVYIKSPVKSVMLQCRSAIDVMIAFSNAPVEDYWTLKSGSSCEMDLSDFDLKGFLYAKPASGTPQLEIFTLI